MTNVNLLVVVDESEASKRAVRYVARVVGGQRKFCVRLSHVLPPLPPKLLETGGAETPEEEERLEARLKADQRRWIAAAKKKAQPALDLACGILREAGLAAEALRTEFFGPVDGRDMSEEILALARARTCRTIVVGRESLTWLGELVSGGLAEGLVRRGKGSTIWVVE